LAFACIVSNSPSVCYGDMRFVYHESSQAIRKSCKFLLTLPLGNDLLCHSLKCRRTQGANLHLCLAGGGKRICPSQSCLARGLIRGVGIQSFSFRREKLFPGVTLKRSVLELFVISGGIESCVSTWWVALQSEAPLSPSSKSGSVNFRGFLVRRL